MKKKIIALILEVVALALTAVVAAVYLGRPFDEDSLRLLYFLLIPVYYLIISAYIFAFPTILKICGAIIKSVKKLWSKKAFEKYSEISIWRTSSGSYRVSEGVPMSPLGCLMLLIGVMLIPLFSPILIFIFSSPAIFFPIISVIHIVRNIVWIAKNK